MQTPLSYYIDTYMTSSIAIKSGNTINIITSHRRVVTLRPVNSPRNTKVMGMTYILPMILSQVITGPQTAYQLHIFCNWNDYSIIYSTLTKYEYIRISIQAYKYTYHPPPAPNFEIDHNLIYDARANGLIYVEWGARF